MTDKKVLWIRIIIGVATFIALSVKFISFFRNWFSGPIYTVLLIVSFITFANGVSYLSEILKKDRNYLKIAIGIFSIILYFLCLVPINRETSPIIQWIIFLILLFGFSLSSILISRFSLFEFTQINSKLRWFFSFLFALNSGIYSLVITSIILRDYNLSEIDLILIGFGAIIFLISMIVNYIAVSSLENKYLECEEFSTIDKKVLWFRILIAVATFIVLSFILVDWFLKEAKESSYRWHPNPIETVLFIISFLTLANGVSYLTEILKKDRKYLKILTGILSLIIFVFTLFPQDQDTSPIIGGTIIIGLSLSSILISVFSTLEWAQIKKRLKWLFPFLFALNSGIYSCLIAAFIQRGSNSEGGLFLIGFGAIFFLINMILNLVAVSSLKKQNQE